MMMINNDMTITFSVEAKMYKSLIESKIKLNDNSPIHAVEARILF